MSAKASTLVRQANPGRHTRPAGPARLRNGCLALLIMLVVQYGLGIFLNLYASVPASDHDAGIAHEIASGPTSLTLHATLGLALIVTSIVLLIRAIAARSPVIILLVALGLGAILGAFTAGEIFVRGDGSNSASMTMAFLTGVALLCYIGTLALLKVAQSGAAPVVVPQPVPVPRPVPAPVARQAAAPPLPQRSGLTPAAPWPALSRQPHAPASGVWPAKNPRHRDFSVPEG